MSDLQMEERFIATVIENECADEAYSSMKSKWILSVEGRQAWDLIASHYQKHQTTITREEFIDQMPGWRFVPEAESISGLVKSLQKRYIRTKFIDTLDEADVDDANPEESLTQHIDEMQRLRAEIETGDGENLAKTAHTVKDRYEERKKNKGAVGIEWPWLPLQESTLGAHEGMYTVFYARPKNMKSWLVIHLLAFWLERHEGRKVLIVNRELTVPQFQDRFAAMLAGVPYDKFRKAQLTNEEKSDLDDAIDFMTECGFIFIEAIYSDGSAAASEIDALCEKHELSAGDFLLIDGMYFYAGSSDWQLMRDFSKGVQKVTKRRNLITTATTQGNRSQGKANTDAGEELGLGDGPINDCDLGIRVALDSDTNELTLSVRAIREGMPCSFVINALLCTDFTLKYTNDYFADEDDPKKPPRGEKKSNVRDIKAPTAVRTGPTDRPRVGGKKQKSKPIRPRKKRAA